MPDDQDTSYRFRLRERTPIRGSRAEPSVPEALPVGSDPELIPPLAIPEAPTHTVAFGGVALVVERHGSAVTLVLPGGVRIQGSLKDAEALAMILTQSRR